MLHAFCIEGGGGCTLVGEEISGKSRYCGKVIFGSIKYLEYVSGLGEVGNSFIVIVACSLGFSEREISWGDLAFASGRVLGLNSGSFCARFFCWYPGKLICFEKCR